MNTGLEGKYVIKNNQKMALGYTTGSCAAAAAKAAAEMILSSLRTESVRIMTPKGIALNLEVVDQKIGKERASCAIRKYSGDDPDVTNGILIYAEASFGERTDEKKVTILGGEGVGRVTKPGLEQPVGAAAINRVPQKMIRQEVLEILEEYDYFGEMIITISIPEGKALARKTFNPRLGIEGGISILGTTGIVEPMSEQALIASIRLEMQIHRKNGGEYLVVSPGNYGSSYLKEHFPINSEKIVKCSNFLGETIDFAVELGFRGILFVSHIGKFIKVAGGIMNTHSRCADARMEILAANALRAGADLSTLSQILEAVTTEDGLDVLNRHGYLEGTMEQVMKQIRFYIDHRAYEKLELGILVFSNEQGELGRIGEIEELLKKAGVWKETTV